MASPSCRRRSSRRSTGCSRQKSSTTSDSPLRWNSSRRSSTSALRQRSRSSPRRGETPVCSAPEHHGAAPPARRLIERGNPDICTLRRQRKTRLEIPIHNLLEQAKPGRRMGRRSVRGSHIGLARVEGSPESRRGYPLIAGSDECDLSLHPPAICGISMAAGKRICATSLCAIHPA